jgi:hypothetical protein
MIVQGITPAMSGGRLLDRIEIRHVNRSFTLAVFTVIVIINSV